MKSARLAPPSGDEFEILVDGAAVPARHGESVAAALLAAGLGTTRRTARSGEERGVFCGMGVCFDCLISVNGAPHRRACLTPAVSGMIVTVQDERNWRQVP